MSLRVKSKSRKPQAVSRMGLSGLLVIGYWLLVASEALACSACFLKVDNAMTRGMNAGVLSLLAILVVVLGGFLTFIFYLWKRSKVIASKAKQSHQEDCFVAGAPRNDIQASKEMTA
jgi:hypothetical protein